MKFTEVGPKMENEKEDANMKFEETELRLGMPGGGGDHRMKNSNISNNNGKRGFKKIVDLKLSLISSELLLSSDENVIIKMPSNHHPTKPLAKGQVVGWPPVRSFRKNILAVQKISNEERQKIISSNVNAAFVKVCMDGAPYLRKVDLKMYNSYKELSDALANLFSSFTIGNSGMKDFMNESKLMDFFSGSDFVPTYQDKDGDWMLIGDVPWEMFVDSCKRLRIIKGTDAKGLAPRAMEVQENKLNS